jgi:RNA polymerase sigma-70 factor (ECF subfamily)
MIKGVARRWGVPSGNVDGVVQEVLLSVHNLLATFDPSRSYHAWLTAIAKRRAIDLLRSLGRRAIREVHDPNAYENHPDNFSVEERADQRSEARRLGHLLWISPRGSRKLSASSPMAVSRSRRAPRSPGEAKRRSR